MGVEHPAENKVVMEVDTRKLHFLTPAQRLTLYKLVGQRYNPTKNHIKFSCEMFEQQAQNKRYLSDLFDTLVNEVKVITFYVSRCLDFDTDIYGLFLQNGKDDFADIPLDLRHHKPKKELKFPKEWLMTPEKMLAKRRKDWQAAPESEKEEMLLAASEYAGRTIAL